jgi:hypothetical protein
MAGAAWVRLDTGYFSNNKGAAFRPLMQYIGRLPSGRFGLNRRGAGGASTPRPPARPTQEVRHG